MRALRQQLIMSMPTGHVLQHIKARSIAIHATVVFYNQGELFARSHGASWVCGRKGAGQGGFVLLTILGMVASIMRSATQKRSESGRWYVL